ncbi:unnamed protein product, partial [Brachionus calyciflorus]
MNSEKPRNTGGQYEKRNKKNFKNKQKFQPNFKKKVPVWKQIDSEINQLLPLYDQIEPNKIESFDDFPLSKRTLDGL